MKFSLILATLGRSIELDRFLESLARQTFRDFELIVVDQNPDDRLVPLLSPYSARFAIRHLRSKPGISFARNVALRGKLGDVVGFPDDDCWHEPDFLERVDLYLAENPSIAGLSGRITSAEGNERGRWAKHPGPVTMLGLFNRIASITFFLRRSVVERVGYFDETLGLGAKTSWQGAEDYDYILRALKAGFRIHYDPGLIVHHDDLPAPDEAGVRRTYRMCMGTGRFLAKHRYPIWYIGYWFGGSLGLAALALLRGNPARAKYHWVSTLGKYQGWAARA
jgi:glycosyltransferase involved in cell wall biosynthesis